MDNNKEFRLFAKSKGASMSVLDSFTSKTNFNPIAGYISPTILEERQLNVTQMDVFSRLMRDRIIFLGTGIDDDVSNIITSQLLYLEQSDNSDINLYINSPGGVVYGGYGIYDVMQYISSDVATYCTGMAASMAAVLLSAGTNGKRYAMPHSRVMIHQPLGGTGHAQASDIEITAREISRIKDELYNTLSKHTGKDYNEILKDADRDFWMTSEEAKEYGMIDMVLTK